MKRSMGYLATAALLMVWASLPAVAQSMPGPFERLDLHWIAPNGTVGIQRNGAQITVDVNGDGFVNDLTLTLPSEFVGAETYLLSPTRRHLYIASRSAFLPPPIAASPCAGDSWIAVLRVPTSAAGQWQVVHAQCMESISWARWYETGLNTDWAAIGGPRSFPVSADRLGHSSQRVLVVCDEGPLPDVSRVHWFNLNDQDVATGRETTAMTAPATTVLMINQIAPSGTHAAVHDVRSFGSVSDYKMVQLCTGPDFGHQVFPSGPQPDLDDVGGATLVTTVENIAGGTLDLSVSLDGAFFTRFLGLPDCISPGSGPSGACCTSGMCAQTMLAACSGTWIANQACAPETCVVDPPPATLSITATGSPAMVQEFGLITYTLTVQNAGPGPAGNVVVRDVLPADYISSSPPATLGFANAVTWNLGLVPANTTRVLTVTCRARCSSTPTSTIVNNNFAVGENGLANIVGSPAVTTQVQQIPPAPLDVHCESTPLDGLPLRVGRRVRHTITVTDAQATAREGLQIFLSTVVSTISDATCSTGTLNVSNQSQILWNGGVPANGTTTISFISTMRTCLGWGGVEDPIEQINGGNGIQVFDQCSRRVGAAPTQYFYLEPPASLVIGAVPSPGLAGPLQRDEVFFKGQYSQPVRENASIEVQLLLRRNFLVPDQDELTFTHRIPDELIVADPPFVAGASLPAGTTWDAPSRTISFAGQLPVGEHTIRYATQVPPTMVIYTEHIQLAGSGEFEGGCHGFEAGTTLMPVAEPPSDPYAINLTSGSVLLTVQPTTGQELLPLTRFPWFSGFTSLHRADNGDCWMPAHPLVMLNPDTLDYRIAPRLLADQLAQGESIDHIIPDPSDPDRLLLFGRAHIGGVATPSARIWSYQWSTRALTSVFTGPGLGSILKARRLITGRYLLLCAGATGGDLRDIDLNAPWPLPAGATVPWPQAAIDYSAIPSPIEYRRIDAIAVEADGRVLALDSTHFQFGGNNFFDGGRLTALVRYDPATRIPTVLSDRVNGYWESGGITLPMTRTREAVLAVTLDNQGRLVGLTPEGSQTSHIMIISPTLPPTVERFSTILERCGEDLAAAPGDPPPCIADFDASGGVSVQDIFAFLEAYFSASPLADINGDDTHTVQDIFDFLNAYFAGC